MKNAGGILILLIIAISIGWYLRARNLALLPEASQRNIGFLKSPLTPGPFPTEAPLPAPTLAPNATPSAQAVVATPAPVATPPLAPLNKVTPTVSALRDEVAKDPHTTPQSLLKFGLEVGERMEKALGSESDATSFLPELDTCVRNSTQDVPQSAQALCLESARDFAKKYPNLKRQVDEISAHADPRAAKLAHER